MGRLVALGTVLAFVSVCHTSAQISGTVVVDDGRVGIGLITGGKFEPGSFSIGAAGSRRPPQLPPFLNNANGHGEQQGNYRPPHRGHEDETNNSGGGIRGNEHLNPAMPLTTYTYSGQGGKGGEEGGSGGGKIIIGTVVLPNYDNNKGNKNNYRKPVVTGASDLEAIIGSNGEQDSIQIGAISGGNFEYGAWSLNNKKRPAASVPQNTGYPYTGSEALHNTYIHGAHNYGAGNAGHGYNQGQINSGYNSGSYEKPWIWD